MKVSAAVVESGLKTVEDVMKCLKSENMYLNPVLYNLLCSGIESGKLKNMPKLKQPSTLRSLLTVAHEAHLRLELFFSLGSKSSLTTHRLLMEKKGSGCGKSYATLCTLTASGTEIKLS
jgi:hypothetical protein